MQIDPGIEWQRLTRVYGEKSDEELLELGEDFGNLTEIAQQVLRDEMKKRSLAVPQESAAQPPQNRPPAFPRWTRAVSEPPAPTGEDEDQSDEQGEDRPREYTWKTLLRTCDTGEEAWQICEMLKRSNIDCWIVAPAQGSLDVTGPRVVVAADQLDEARAIAARPIPQEIIEQSKSPIEDFEPPACPECGAPDPLLEDIDPCNRWRCEACGAEWSDTPPAGEES